jgi:beta-glucosidase
VYDDGSDSARAAKLAASADVDLVLVFLGVSSAENHDRSSLSFPADQEELVAAVAAAAGKKTAVVMMAPGAILTPWAKDVAAALTMHMPGLECGNALADVLFGDVNPTGRLSYTLPNVENEQGFTALQWPGVNAISVYSEKLEFGYRWYDAHKVTPAFAFGHGLSYTTFTYSAMHASASEVSVTVTNSGSVAGAEVAQLYLTFPPATTGEPPLQLKGFMKTRVLAKGASATVTFQLRDRDLSIWDVAAHAWAKQPGAFSASVGASSRDIRLAAHFTV